jgi:hypothetical protein
LSALLWKAPEPVIPSPLITAIADTPFYKVKPSLPPLPAESKKLSRRADAVPWPQKQKTACIYQMKPRPFSGFWGTLPLYKRCILSQKAK